MSTRRRKDLVGYISGEELAKRIGVSYPTLMVQAFKYGQEPDAIAVDANNTTSQPLFLSTRTYDLSKILFPEIES